MNRILKSFALLFGLALLSACGDAPYVSQRAVLESGASIQTAVAGGGLRGTEETLVEVTTPQGTSHLVRSGYGLGRELVLATVPGVVNTVTGGVVAGVLQGRGCGNSCGGDTFVIQGGQAVAGATADSDSSSTVNINTPTCPIPRPDGSCPAAP